MMKRLLIAGLSLLLVPFLLPAQLLTWSPEFAQVNNSITITVDASKGNRGLFNYASPNDVYVHIGLITSESDGPGDWELAPFTWGTTTAAAKATPLGNNRYSYTINNIHTFFGVRANETVHKIAILFRSGNGSLKQANTDNSDMYVPIYSNDLATRFTAPVFQPTFNPTPEPFTKTVNDDIVLSAISSKPATLNLYLNGNLIQTATSATSISATPTLTTAGSKLVVVEAIDGATVAKDSIRFFVTGSVTTAPLPAGVRDGINYVAGQNSAILVLYAPGKSRVNVIGEFAGSDWVEQYDFQMNKTPDGNYWWLQLDNLLPGVEYAYQYLVDGNLRIADPYAEKILDNYNNNDQEISPATYPNLKPYPTGKTQGIVSLLQTNAPAYNWVNNTFNRPDQRNLVIYELLVRDFVDAHDWKTLKDTIAYLKRMGVNAIELMPFNEFEGNNSWGYNPDFYFAPDKYYGPKNTFKEFVDVCHSNGIAVIMDIALNHSFGLSPMVQLYWDANTSRPAANNPWFNPTPRHAYNVGFDMNHESPATKAFFSRVVEHWLTEYKLDGFRFDLSKGFTQKQTCDANGNNCNVNTWGQYDATRVAIWKAYFDTLQLKSAGSYVILEHFADNDEDKALADYGMMLWGNMNHAFNEGTKGVIAGSSLEGALHIGRNWTKPNLITYMESHDEERMAFRNITSGLSSGTYNVRDTVTSLKRNGLAAAFLLAIPGPKMIWQFGELGYDFPINYCIQDQTINDGCRTGKKPIRWDYRQDTRRLALYDIYVRMGALRHHGWYKDIFTANNIQIERSVTGGVKWLKLRSATDSSMLCIIGNFELTSQAPVFQFPTAGTWYDYFGKSTFTATGVPQAIPLLPGEFRIYLNRNVDNIAVTPVFDPTAPANTLLAAVYPNPVTSSSVLELNIPETGKTEITLLTLDGRAVRPVLNRNLPRGVHTITIADKMPNLPAGIYLLKIQSRNQSRSLKIVVR